VEAVGTYLSIFLGKPASCPFVGLVFCGPFEAISEAPGRLTLLMIDFFRWPSEDRALTNCGLVFITLCQSSVLDTPILETPGLRLKSQRSLILNGKRQRFPPFRRLPKSRVFPAPLLAGPSLLFRRGSKPRNSKRTRKASSALPAKTPR